MISKIRMFEKMKIRRKKEGGEFLERGKF